jgi:hypothetical protein
MERGDKIMKEKDADKMEKDMLRNKKKYIGTTITIEGGFKCLVIGIGKEGIRSMPIDCYIDKNKQELKKVFKEIFPKNKVSVAIMEVEKRKNEINGPYG